MLQQHLNQSLLQFAQYRHNGLLHALQQIVIHEAISGRRKCLRAYIYGSGGRFERLHKGVCCINFTELVIRPYPPRRCLIVLSEFSPSTIASKLSKTLLSHFCGTYHLKIVKFRHLSSKRSILTAGVKVPRLF